MDDLNGLDWTAGSSSVSNKTSSAGTGNYFTTLRPTVAPLSSGRSTPLSAQASGAFKPATAGIPKTSSPDSFSNLVSFGSAKQGNRLTLQEQQEKLEEEKVRRAAEQKKQYDSQFGNSHFWDGLGSQPKGLSGNAPATSRSSTPATGLVLPGVGSLQGSVNGSKLATNNGDDDLFAAFNADTKVDNSSYYPPPSIASSERSTPFKRSETKANTSLRGEGDTLGDDDDPFGLGQMGKQKANIQDLARADEDDDFLGDLGKPVEEVKSRARQIVIPEQQASEESLPQSDDPWDKAVAELVDMGFSAENSRRALTESGSGLDVQAAVGWLLNDAHRQAKQKAQSKSGSERILNPESVSGQSGQEKEVSADRSGGETVPAWMRQESRSQSQQRRDESRSPANSDNDISKTAAAVGSNFLKTANSLWKTSQKKVQKAVSDLAQDSDPSQPKWMRDISTDRQQQRERPSFPEGLQRGRKESSSPQITDEALMLDGGSRPIPRKVKAAADTRFLAPKPTSSRDKSPVISNPPSGRSTPLPRWQQSSPAPSPDPRTRLSKQAIEEQSAQAYISPARRKKATTPSKAAEKPDLFFGNSLAGSAQPTGHPENGPPRVIAQPQAPKTSKPLTPIPTRPKAPPRNIPPLSAAALAISTQHRLAGTAHFKRGDYASAHSSYTSSLGSLTQGHPITIILLCNRSLTALKTGDPKAAVSDADTALTLIGPGRGENDSIDLGDGTAEAKKPMQEFWVKALIRKAEALEQMERWKDAGAVWQEAVEAGIGAATAIQGRQRCEKALAPKPKPSTPRQPQKHLPKSRSALNDLAPGSTQSTAAVSRLRAANLAAEKADDEKFALSDSVDARISKWRDGRKDNLRALLGGLDQVLWEASGWKKVGMHELVVNGKVKIVYMKAIARVHPDKLPQDATTEIKMISASVFATLNEAWDKFKTENGM